MIAAHKKAISGKGKSILVVAILAFLVNCMFSGHIGGTSTASAFQCDVEVWKLERTGFRAEGDQSQTKMISEWDEFWDESGQIGTNGPDYSLSLRELPYWLWEGECRTIRR